MADASAGTATPPFRHLLVLIAAAWLGFWSQLGSAPLFDLDEGAFSEATVEMIGSHNYLTTTLNDEPRYDKPILIYWLQAASVRAFGVEEFAFRLPSAICATLWMLLIYAFTFGRTREPEAALLAACSLALSVIAGLIGHAAIADALLNLLLAAAMFGVYRYGEQPTRARLLGIYVAMALGCLAKGPIAVALPLTVSAVHFARQRRIGLWLRAVFDPLGWLAFGAILALWVVPLWQSGQIDFLRHFLFEHNLGRYGTTLQGHGGRPWFYLLWLPLIVAPFTALLPGALARVRGADALDGFLLIWFALVFVVFSFSATQLPHYLLYGCTPLFVLFGRHWHRLPHKFWLLLPSLLLAAALAALPWVLPLIHVPEKRAFEAGILALAMSSIDLRYEILTFGALAVCALLFVLPVRGRPALIAAAFALGIALWFGVGPVFAQAQQVPVKEAAERARDLGLPAVSYRTYLPSFSIYRGAVTPNRTPQPGELVFLRKDRIGDLQAELGPGVTLIPEFNRGGVALLRRPAEGATPPAVPPSSPGN